MPCPRYTVQGPCRVTVTVMRPPVVTHLPPFALCPYAGPAHPTNVVTVFDSISLPHMEDRTSTTKTDDPPTHTHLHTYTHTHTHRHTRPRTHSTRRAPGSHIAAMWTEL